MVEVHRLFNVANNHGGRGLQHKGEDSPDDHCGVKVVAAGLQELLASVIDASEFQLHKGSSRGRGRNRGERCSPLGW